MIRLFPFEIVCTEENSSRNFESGLGKSIFFNYLPCNKSFKCCSSKIFVMESAVTKIFALWAGVMQDNFSTEWWAESSNCRIMTVVGFLCKLGYITEKSAKIHIVVATVEKSRALMLVRVVLSQITQRTRGFSKETYRTHGGDNGWQSEDIHPPLLFLSISIASSNKRNK